MKLLIKRRLLKTLVLTLEFLAIGLIVFLLVSPLVPDWLYELKHFSLTAQKKYQNIAEVKEETEIIINHLPANNYKDNSNRLIITKIGVNAPIVESADYRVGLNKGAWRDPRSSTPDQGSNMVVAGHRWKYLPPNNLTFYLLDKLTVGDIISVTWQQGDYYYRIKQTKIVDPTDLSILDPTATTTITLYTCTPLYSMQHRLVVIAELVK